MAAGDRNIVLVGFMGAGKSEVGRLVAARTGRSFVDTDELATRNGETIPAIFASEGEAGFRKREREAVARAARSRGAVIATGGGAVLDPRNARALQRSGVVVYLKVGVTTLERRLKGTRVRPLLGADGGRRDRIKGLLADRAPLYEAVADHVVVCDGLGPAATADAVLRAVSGTEPRVRSVRVATDPPYRVVVGRSILDRMATLVRLSKDCERVGIVSHPRLRTLWGEPLARALARQRLVVWLTFPPGEQHKTPATVERLQRSLATAGFHRSDVLFALGGGVVGDVTGYVASTYGRGLGYVQVPTTLLAMVDASIGGKTGVNLPEGKNLVGTFHQPAAVVADLDALRTLPDRELRGGLAEVVKTALIAEPGLLTHLARHRDDIFARDGASLEPVILRCARVKAKVVAADERESGLRMILNYGHTLGHALEAASGRIVGTRGLHHGEAISVGMVFAAEVAEATGRARAGLADGHREVLSSLGLPVTVPGMPWKDVRRYMGVDKKFRRGFRMVLLEAPGRPVIVPVDDGVLRAAYEKVIR